VLPPAFELRRGFCPVQLRLVGHDDVGRGAVGALDHKPLRQRVPVDLLVAVAGGQHRDQVLAAAPLLDVVSDRQLVRHAGVQWVPVVELDPLQLLVVQHRVLQIQPAPQLQPVLELQVRAVGHEVHKPAPAQRGQNLKALQAQLFAHVNSPHGRINGTSISSSVSPAWCPTIFPCGSPPTAL